MSNEPVGLLPFVPGGADYEESRRLFLALGFRETWSNSGYTEFVWGAAKFILQDYNEPAFAQNLMMKLEVEDLDAWWTEIEPKLLAEKIPGFRINPPTAVPWGREVCFIDLAGVCWHVGK